MKKKLREKYQRIFENGVSLIESAEKVAEIKNFGTSASLLILGLEELIKYQVYLNNTGEEKVFGQSEFGKVFTDHKTKHNLISEFQEAIKPEFAEKFQQYVLKMATNQELDDSDLEIKRNRFNEMGSFLSNIYKETNLTESEILNFQNWLKHADGLKNKGFYVGLKKSQWTFPSQITEKEYKIALKYVCAVKNQIEVSKSLDLIDDEFIELLNG